MLALQVNQLQAFAEATPGAVLLDVREPWELALARVELPELPLRHVPMHEIPGRLAELDPAQPVVCICHHGVRSAQVVAFLQRRGWAHAYNLDGGIDAWSALVDPAVPRY
jgi:rhodanese-related sulfurtransferase